MDRGDHLYVERLGGLYSHHAIDCGDGTVVHYWPDETAFGSSVRRTTLGEFAEGGEVRVREYEHCDPPRVVVARALSRLGAGGFDPLTSNCEHFAVWCKTGRLESSQVSGAESYLRDQAAAVALMLSPILLPAAVFAALFGNVLRGLAGEAQGRAATGGEMNGDRQLDALEEKL